MAYIVELQEGCWLAPWRGDPGRTLVEASAKQFETEASAKRGLTAARRWHPFLNAVIRGPNQSCSMLPDAEAKWKSLKEYVLHCIADIDRSTTWGEIEPSWWLHMKSVDREIRRG